MTAIRSSKLVVPVTFVLMVTMLTLFVPVGAISRAEAQPKLLLLFPVLDRTDEGNPEVAERLTPALQIAMGEIAGLRVAEFSPDSPMVRRAVREGQIRSVDVDAEVTDAFMAIQIGHALGVDEVCLAMVTSVTTQDEPRGVEVVLAGQVHDVVSNIDETSGQVVERPLVSSSFGVSGKSRERAEYTGSDRALVNEAIRSAAYKAAQVLAGRPAEEMGKVGRKQMSSTWRWVLLGLAVAGLAMAAHNSTEHPGTGVSPDAVAPRADRLVIEPTSIRLYWDPPEGTSLVLLRYQIQRSVNDGGWNFIDEGNVDATDTSFADFNVQQGNTYRYRMCAQYASCGPSGFSYFNRVTFSN